MPQLTQQPIQNIVPVDKFLQDFTEWLKSFYQSFMQSLPYGLYGALIGFSIIPCLLIILGLLGFCCIGIQAGSYAAIRQSSHGNVSKNSCFSCCQSIGMSPLTLKLIPLFTVLGYVLGIIYYIL